MTVITKDKTFYKRLIALAIPVAAQNLITFIVNFADNLMVGALSDAAVSGVYMGGQIHTFLQMFSGGIEGALLILAAQYWGKKDKQSIKLLTSAGVRISCIVSLVVFAVCFLLPDEIIGLFTTDSEVIENGAAYLKIVCFSYIFFCLTQTLIASMRSVEVAKIGMAVSGISLFINIGFNYALIFGKFGFPEMGVRGAAVATVIARVCETAIMMIYVFCIDKKLGLKPKDFLHTDMALTKDFIRYGLPIVGGQAVWSINLLANSAIIGRFSAEVITAASVANTMNSLAYVTMQGMSSAVGIITGKTIGEGKTELMKEYARTVQVMFFAIGLLTGAAVYLIKNPFVSMYMGITVEAAAYSKEFITVLSVTIIGTCYQAACLFGLVKSGGDVGFVFKNDSIFVFLVVLPSAIISAYLGAPPWVVFACLKCDQILKCFVAVVKINKFNWMKKLTR